MNTPFLKTTVLGAALSAVTLLLGSCASTDHKHQHPAAQAEVKIPNRAADIFAETDKHLQALAAAIKSKDPRAAHQHDTAVRELIGSIPKHATPDIKAHVDRHVREIADAAKSAHVAAHNDEWAKADSDVKRAQQSLKYLQANFKEVPH